MFWHRPPRLTRRAFLGALGASALAWNSRLGHVWAAAPAPPSAPPIPGGSSTPPTAFEAAAQRALAGLQARLDPAAGYRPHFLLDFTTGTAQLVHDTYWDSVDLAGRSVDALIRLRAMLGVDESEAEVGLRNYFLGRQGAGGLFYNDQAPDGTGVADTFCQGRALLALTTWFAATGDAEIETRLQWLVDGLAAIATTVDDYSFYPGIKYLDGWRDYALTPDEAYDGLANYGYASQCALPLLEYHALSGHTPALALAGRLLRHFVVHAGLVSAEGHFAGETHASGYLPMAIAAARYGAATDDETYIDWADRLYRWVRANSSSFGWVPGPLGLGAAYFERWYGAPTRRTCETCSLADALELAITLAHLGHAEYWDDVERLARNQLLQNQYGASDVVLRATGCAEAAPSVCTALAGAWESFALPYRLLARPDDRPLVEGCCSASGARALCQVWEQALEQRGGTLFVHLGLTRESPWARVTAHEPAAGQLDVVPHQPLALRLRVPSWAPPDSVTLWVDGAQRDARRASGYVVVDEVPAGATVSLRYALTEREEGFAVNGETMLAYWRGGTVLDVLPDQGPLPIYQPPRTALAGGRQAATNV